METYSNINLIPEINRMLDNLLEPHNNTNKTFSSGDISYLIKTILECANKNVKIAIVECLIPLVD